MNGATTSGPWCWQDSRDADPGRRYRPRDRRGRRPGARCAGRPLRLGRPAGRPGGHPAGGDPLPQATLDSIRRTKLALKGPLTTPVGGGFRSVNVRLREEFHLYANLRPAHTLVPGGRFENIDLVLVRENLEGLYVAFEHYIPIGDDPHAVAISSGVNTRDGSRQNRTLCVRARAEARPQEGHHRPQGQRAESADRRVPGYRARRGQGIRGPARLRRPDRGRLRDAARAEPLAVRRDRHDEPVRRHPVRSDRRPGGWPGRGARVPTSARKPPSSKRCTARRRISRARASPTRPRCCSPPA